MWWDTDRIERTVTRQFVCSHLLPEEIARLDLPLGFGDGLTDGTYWEWIDEKAKRIFLILVDLGIPDQIFGVIDDSWDDEDLPIALDQVERLALTRAKDQKLERRFFSRQFQYLLRHIEQGDHVVYDDVEVVPIDVVEKRQGLALNNTIDKVELPNLKGLVFCRRRIPLGLERGCLSEEELLYEVDSIRNLQNEHLVSYWGSYVHQGYGYVLFSPASDFSLKSFLTTTPNCYKNLDKPVRRQLVMNWIHCLVDTLCFVHNRGLSHGNIKPSTVLFTNENHIFYSDFTHLNADELASTFDKTSFDKESYDYAAPEQWFRPTGGSTSPGAHRKATLSSMSSSPDNFTFSISRGGADHGTNNPQTMLHAPNPHLNPQAADVFSLGCVILELLSFLLKRQTRAFATHRSARHKTPGRGGAVLDASFHRNLGQVETWMSGLAKDAAKKRDDAALCGVAPMLRVVERMLAYHPAERPSAHDVQARLYQIVTEACGVAEPHCVHRYGGWDFGIGSLKLCNVTSLDSTPPLSRNESWEAVSVLTKSSSGSAGGRSLDHKRTNSSGSGGRGRAKPRERETSAEVVVPRGRGGVQAKGMQVKDKNRAFQAPIYAGKDLNSPPIS